MVNKTKPGSEQNKNMHLNNNVEQSEENNIEDTVLVGKMNKNQCANCSKIFQKDFIKRHSNLCCCIRNRSEMVLNDNI